MRPPGNAFKYSALRGRFTSRAPIGGAIRSKWRVPPEFSESLVRHCRRAMLKGEDTEGSQVSHCILGGLIARNRSLIEALEKP